jgi:hypothetical protein
MSHWPSWTNVLLLINLLWLCALSLRVRRLAKQLTTPKPGTRPTEESLRQPVSVAELLAREDPDRRPEPLTDKSSAELSADTEPVVRPRQRIRLGPPNRTETDPSPWFQPSPNPTNSTP